ncbi:AraC family transcriptional regulator [Chryseobacterium sp.]|uniref:helix-turn-helix transcriptional regulator n=1 Tax=Chryseobacterium sp. TaxID=1871047 RepID=UPI0025BF553F|nr:AraC family transcriptional regulator [Chryseobacterium sp.]
MDIAQLWITQKPIDKFLSTIVDEYFYLDTTLEELKLVGEEYMFPFPRITFGYFFNHPFLVTNHTQNQELSKDMIISRISTDHITVRPQSEKIKILGAHVQPYCLAYYTNEPIHQLPWLINTQDLFNMNAISFKNKINTISDPAQMFEEIENIFLENILIRDLSLITQLVRTIHQHQGQIQIKDLAIQFQVSERTIRSHFNKHIGCSPKEYIRLVKIRQIAFQMKHSNDSLSNITYENEYFDQSHFIHEIKNITGKSPGELKKEIHSFRFLQF